MRGLEYQHFIVAEVVVAGGDDLFAWLEAFEDFVELRILAADADLTLYGLASFRSYDIYPFAAGLLVECASMNEHGTFRLSQLEVEVVCLSGSDV